MRRDVPLPAYATTQAAAMDLAAALDEPVVLAPGERRRIPTGLAIQLPRRDLVALIFARSGLASRDGLTLANGVGVIDADYTGELQCALINLGEAPVTIRHGDRIAQLAVLPIETVRWLPVDSLEETERGTGGFGSTGIASG